MGERDRGVPDASESRMARSAEESPGRLQDALDIINRSPAVAFLWQNKENWPVEYVSENVESLFGHSAEDFTEGRVFYAEAVHPDDIGRVGQEVAEASETPGQENFSHEPYRIITKDGAVRWLDDRTYIRRDESGAITHYQGIVLDITAQKQAELDRLRLRREVEHVEKLTSLGVLAGGIAHDFNNLLVGILTNASLLKDGACSDQIREECVDDILSASQHAAKLTSAMLAYSGKGEFDIRPLDLNRLVDDTRSLLRSAISKKVDISFDLALGLPPIEADQGQLKQVLLNLVTNGAESIGADVGTVTVRTLTAICDRADLESARIDQALEPGPYVIVQVSDSGGGLDEATRTKIFDPFFSTKQSGHGLGLAVVLGIVRGHKGGIEVGNAPGGGALFRVFFAASKNAVLPPSQQGPRPERDWAGGGAVLLVDDEPVVRRAARRILEKLGFSVIGASDGLEALEIYRERHAEIRCVLLDLKMPGLDGVETFKGIREISADTPVILCSGYTEEKSTKAFDDGDLSGFLQKPYTPEEMEAQIRETLES